MRPWYATREAVKETASIALSARDDARVDRAIESASDTVDGELRRRFYPVTGTWRHPAPSGASGRVLFLDAPGAELAAAPEAVRVGGQLVDAGDYRPEPAAAGPPFRRLEFAAAVTAEVEIDGTTGYRVDEAPVAQLAGVVDDSTTVVEVTSGARVGAGSLLRVGTERMIVTGRAMLATGVTLAAELPASTGATAVEVSGSGVEPGEVVLVGGERLRVVDAAGNTLVVRRAWDGTVLAGHSAGVELLALRRLTVRRGVLGTEAAGHDADAPVLEFRYPGTVVAFAVTAAQYELIQWAAGQGHDVDAQGGRTALDRARANAVQAAGVGLLIA